MRKVPALLASALLLSTIAAGVGPMMATAAAPAVSPRPSIEVKSGMRTTWTSPPSLALSPTAGTT